MKIQRTILLSLIASTLTMAAELTPNQTEAKKSLEEIAGMEEGLGSIFVQARLDKINYRPILNRAIGLEKPALISLFGMQFMGEGGETHCAILKDLMMLWGDEKFTEALGEQPEKVREMVVGSIDYAWADPIWTSYPKTLTISPESVEAR